MKYNLDVKSNELRTTYSELASIIPSLRNVTNPDLKALGNIRFKGNFKGFFTDFVTDGTLNTNLGTVATNLHMQFPANSPPFYSGKL